MPLALVGLLASLALWEILKYYSDRWKFDHHPSARKLVIGIGQCGFTHAAFTLGYEAGIKKSSIDGNMVPPGALVKFLQKGLQHMQMEANLSNELPIWSQLDPYIYGPPESALTEEVIAREIEHYGITIEQVTVPGGRDRKDELLVIRDNGNSFKIIHAGERDDPTTVIEREEWTKTRENMEKHLRMFN